MNGQEEPTVPTQIPVGLVRAQELARAIVTELEPFVRVGVTEIELDEQATKIAVAHGSTGFWSPSTTRVGLGTLVAHPDFPMQDRQAQAGDTVIVDIACSLDGWCGDQCTTFTLEPAPETSALVEDCRWVYERLIQEVRPGMRACDLYGAFAGALAPSGLVLLDRLNNVGHSLDQGTSYDLGYLDPWNETPLWGAWAVEPFVGNHLWGVKLEDVIWFGGDEVTLLR